MERKTILTFLAKDEASGAVKNLNGEMGKLEGQGGKLSGLFGKVGGAAAAMAKVGIGLAIGAIAGFGAAIAKGVKDAAEEQVGIERLNTALQNNVASWDGNRDAIEKVIDQRTQLAFADDALRDSLSTLVTRTGDVNKAMDLQALAMDLARAKGIDLSTASEIIGKVYSGNTGILARYGIAVEKGASATDALAAIQKSSAGQAEAYGKTTSGAFEAFNIAIGNVFEDVGSQLLPILTDLALFLTGTVVPAVKDVIGRVQQWLADNKPLVDQLTDFAGIVLKSVVDGIGFVITKAGEFITWIVNNETIMTGLKNAVALIARAFNLAKDAIGFVIGKAGEFVAWITSDKDVLNTLQGLAEGIGGAFKIVADNVAFVIQKLDELGRWIRENADVIGRLSPFGASYSDLFNEVKRRVADPRVVGGSYAVGAWNLPNDMVAQVHKGEMIVPARHAAMIRNGGGFGGANITINVNGGGRSSEDVANEVMLRLKREVNRQGMPLTPSVVR